MPEQHVYLHDLVALGANASGTVTFGPTGAEAHILRAWSFEATGVFRLKDIRDTAGRHYVADETGNGFDSTLITPTEFTVLDLLKFIPPIELGPGMQVHFDVVDISGAANTVRILIAATKTVG